MQFVSIRWSIKKRLLYIPENSPKKSIRKSLLSRIPPFSHIVGFVERTLLYQILYVHPFDFPKNSWDTTVNFFLHITSNLSNFLFQSVVLAEARLIDNPIYIEKVDHMAS